MSLNDEIKSRAIRHAVLIERLKNKEADQVIRALTDEILPDILDSIRRVRRLGIEPAGLTKSLALIKDIVNDPIKLNSANFTETLLDIAVMETSFQKAGVKGVTALGVDFTAPSLTVLRSAIKKNPFQGKVLNKWYKSLSADISAQTHAQLVEGLRIGETVPQLTQRIKGTASAAFADGNWAKQMRNAEAVTRTAINHSVTQAREETYKANEDVIKGVQYVATLDSNTTEICAGLDGQVFPIGEGPRPPMHFNCRSTTVPVVKSFKELGIPLKDIPVGTRASINGQVSSKVTYGEWLKKQPQSVQREVLGKTKAELFARGKVDIQGFTNNRFQTLTIKELVKAEGIPTDEIFSLRKQDIA